MATNLEFIKSTTITSAVSTLDITDVFSAEYDVYKIVANDLSTVGTSQTDPDLRFINSSGSVISASNYDYAHLIMQTGSSFTEQRATGQAQLYRFFSESVDQSPESGSQVSYIFNPFSSSSYSFAIYQSFTATAGVKIAMKGIGVLKQAASMTGFQVRDSNTTRPFAGGTISVYGVKG